MSTRPVPRPPESLTKTGISGATRESIEAEVDSQLQQAELDDVVLIPDEADGDPAEASPSDLPPFPPETTSAEPHQPALLLRPQAEPTPSPDTPLLAPDTPEETPPETTAPPVQPSAETRPSRQVTQRVARFTGPMLKLDWSILTEAGFLDPRERSGPITAEMDGISRVLVRQAMSDQASWRDRIIVVTSARDGEGKTFAAVNFALGLTRSKKHSVVLVDADVSGCGATRRLGLPRAPGLTNALTDNGKPLGKIVVRTDLGKLALLSSGPAHDDIVDLFASKRMFQILRFLTRDPNTLVVVDSPSLTRQEAEVLSVIAGQVVLVVEAGSTPAEAVEQALRRIGDRPNLSLLLNRCGYAWAGQRRSRTLQQALFRRRTSSGGPMRRRVRKTTALLFAAAMLGTAAGLWFPEHMLRSFTPLPSPIDPPADWRSTADMLRAMS